MCLPISSVASVCQDAEENKLSYTEVFHEYQAVVERNLEQRLSAAIPGFCMETFIQVGCMAFSCIVLLLLCHLCHTGLGDLRQEECGLQAGAAVHLCFAVSPKSSASDHAVAAHVGRSNSAMSIISK